MEEEVEEEVDEEAEEEVDEEEEEEKEVGAGRKCVRGAALGPLAGVRAAGAGAPHVPRVPAEQRCIMSRSGVRVYSVPMQGR